MKNNLFSQYKNELIKVTDDLSLKEAIRSDRKGSRKIRDTLVLTKLAWTESLSYFAIIQSVIIFTALVPNSIENINALFSTIGIGIQLPVASASIIAILLIFFIFVFGIISFRFFGLIRRANEVGALYSPGNLLLYKEIQEIKQQMEEFKKELKK